MTIFSLVLVALLTSVPGLVSGHTWLEQLNRIAANGTLVGPAGYPPNWYGRDSGSFDDKLVTNQITGDNTMLCAKQPLNEQVESKPALTAAPGDFVALRYLENGHVTNLEEGRPLNQGTVYVYGTTDPRPDDELFDVFKKWTPDGKGGDGRGRLLATRNYDDGQCYEANDKSRSIERQQEFPKETNEVYGPNLWCQTDVHIPHDLSQGTQYAIYWVWTWPLLKNVEGSETGQYGDYPEGNAPAGGKYLEDKNVEAGQVYTSCAMINVEGKPLMEHEPEAEAQGDNVGIKSNGKTVASEFIRNRKDYNDAAVLQQLRSQFLVPVDGAPDGSQSSPPPSPTDGEAPDTDGLRTVTVTAEPTTIYATATVTAGPGEGKGEAPAPTSAPEGEGHEESPSRPIETVEPFMPRGNLRRRTAWAFGQGN